MDDSTQESKNLSRLSYHTHFWYPISYQVLPIFFLNINSTQKSLLSFLLLLQMLYLMFKLLFTIWHQPLPNIISTVFNNKDSASTLLCSYPALPFSSYANYGTPLHSSVPPFPHLWNRINNKINLTWLLWGLNKYYMVNASKSALPRVNNTFQLSFLLLFFSPGVVIARITSTSY